MTGAATVQQTEVLESTALNAEYHRLRVRAAAPAATARPGQFFQLLCPASPAGTPFLRRPMSVFGADPAAGEVSFLFKVTGLGTRGLAGLRAGETLDLLGPLGNGFTLDPAWRHIVALGRGAGLATLAPLGAAARGTGMGVSAILSARRPTLMVADDAFRAAGAEVTLVTDAEGTSGPAHVERLLRGLIAAGRCDALFTCGSARLLEVVRRLAQGFGIPAQVALEQQMACGLGMCFCCVRAFRVDGQVLHRRVCYDGPVFDAREALE